jgi:RNA polymerase sigma-B factor
VAPAALATRPEQKEDMRRRFAEFRRTGDASERAKLIEANLGLAEYLARRFDHRREPLEDLVQVACLALVKAVDRFDPTRGLEFSTFAVPTIIGELKRHFRDKGWVIRVPRRLQELHLRMRAAVPELTQELGRSPTLPELGQRTGATPEELIEAMDAASTYQPKSIDSIDNDGSGEPLEARLGVEDPGLAAVEHRRHLTVLLACLPARERDIVVLRFCEGLTQSEIARRVGVSQMHVSRLLARAMAQLRAVGGFDEDGRGSGSTTAPLSRPDRRYCATRD